MCTRLGEVRAALATIVDALDPDDVALCDTRSLWEGFDAVERLAAAAKVLLARRVEGSGAWARPGHRSAEEYLAAKGGVSVGEARRQLETSAKLTKAPATRRALRQGRLSRAQAESIAGAAAANPDAEEQLLEGAKTQSLS